METDERGFEIETRNSDELTLDELQRAYKELAIQNSAQSMQIRFLENELAQLKTWAGDEGLTPNALQEIRNDTLKNYLARLKPLSKKRGRPTPLQEKIYLSNIMQEYASREDQYQKIKPWLRQQIQAEYTNQGKSLITHEPEIKRLVQKIATQISRNKQ